jgi:hypothetical protein
MKPWSTILMTFILAGPGIAGCYKNTSPAHDVTTDDALPDFTDTQEIDVAPDWVDILPDVPPDIYPDVPPDILPDYPPDVPPDYPPDIPPDIWPDYPPDVVPDYPPDYPPDWPPDTPCVSEGCVGTTCCAGLIPATECDPASGDPYCSLTFCIRCGDRNCGPHENCYNCPADCSVSACDLGVGMGYSCGLFESHSCACTGGECRPQCISDSSGVSGWLDPCSGAMIRYDDCRGQIAVCEAFCTRSEGWYESGTGELISWDFCAPRWECEVYW